MNKKKIIALIVGLVILIGLVCSYFFIYSKESDSIRFKREYESLNNTVRKKDSQKIRDISIDEDNPIIYSTEQEVINKIKDKDTFLIYFGFADCPWCRSVLPNLIEAANELGLETIYYVDVRDIRDTIEIQDNGELETTVKGSDGYYELLELLDDVLEDYILKDSSDNDVSTGEKRIFAPNVVSIVDGKATQLEDGISSKQDNAYMDLTMEMNEESKEKFRCIVKCVLDTKEICSADTKC